MEHRTITAHELARKSVDEVAHELATRNVFGYSVPYRFSLAQLTLALALTGQAELTATGLTITGAPAETATPPTSAAETAA